MNQVVYNNLLFSAPKRRIIENPIFPDIFKPNNKDVENILDTGVYELPNTLELLKNPLYSAALNDFAQNQSVSNGLDLSEMSDDELFDNVNNDKDLNNAFWDFVSKSSEYKKQLP